MQSSEGSFTYTNRSKKTRCSWHGSVTPKKNKTVKIQFTVDVNGEQLNMDVDASVNSDQTVNVHGHTTTRHGKKTIRKPIHLDHYNLNSSMPKLL